MAEYIEREALLAEYDRQHTGEPGRARKLIEDAHTIDAVPVVHGRWVDYMVRDWRCSVCGEKIAKVRNVDGYCYEDKPHYCPNCGARMGDS